jgi:hypothetical protein
MLSAGLLLPVLGLAACGGGNKSVDTASYTCAHFTKSLNTKGDNTSGTYINELRKQAKLAGGAKAQSRIISLGIIFACRGKPGTTKPADRAVAIAKQIEAGKFKLPGRPPAKKKSNK